jgi:hypothetical protein
MALSVKQISLVLDATHDIQAVTRISARLAHDKTADFEQLLKAETIG